MKLSVGFDITWMNIENKFGGVFQYAQRLISALVEHADINVVAITGAGGQGLFEHLENHENYRQCYLSSPYGFTDLLKKENIDLVHTPMQSHFNFTVSVPMLNSLHDLQHFHYPKFFTEEELNRRNILFKGAAEFSERVIVSFNYVKEDIVKFYSIPPDKIDICAIGVEPSKVLDTSRFPAIRKKYSIPEHYLFYAANTWKHKNHIGLIRALKILHEKFNQRITLVCTGQKNADFFPEIQGEVKRLGLDTYIRFLGYIPEDDLLQIMNAASLVVMPSFYEAGSFPIREAMIYGVPVVCSNITSHPDYVAEKFMFDPNNIEEMAEKISLLLKDEKLRGENIENSRRRVEEMKWVNSVGSFLESYEKAVSSFKKKRQDRSFADFVDNYEFFMNENCRNTVDLVQRRVNGIQNSLSWRITAPLRWLGEKFKLLSSYWSSKEPDKDQ